MPDSLDTLLLNLRDVHPSVYDGGKWSNLVDLVSRGLQVKPNAQYWPPTNVMGGVTAPSRYS